MFKNPLDIKVSNNVVSASIRNLVVDSSYIYAISSSPFFKKFDINTGQQINTDLTILTNAAAITMITAATACIFSSSASQVDFVDVNTNARTQVTSNATSVYTQTAHQIADSTGGTTLACRTAAGGLLKATSAGVLTNMTVASLSGLNAKCILAEPGSGVWFVGTNAGTVLTVDSAGNTTNTITLSKTPFILSPTVLVTGLSFANPYLLVTTNMGLYHLFDYRSGLEIDRALGNVENTNVSSPSLCPAVSGFTVCGRNKGSNANVQAVESIYFGNGKIFKDTVSIG